MFSSIDEDEYIDQYNCNTESIDYLPSHQHAEDNIRLQRILAEVAQNTRMNWNWDDKPAEVPQSRQGK